MKLSTLAPAALLLFSGAAIAQDAAPAEAPADAGAHPDFATADTDKDGLLSITEIEVAIPGITIEDENGDGFVNQSEVETAINGLAFESEGYTGGSSLVSEPEYDLIVSKLDDYADADVDASDN